MRCNTFYKVSWGQKKKALGPNGNRGKIGVSPGNTELIHQRHLKARSPCPLSPNEVVNRLETGPDCLGLSPSPPATRGVTSCKGHLLAPSSPQQQTVKSTTPASQGCPGDQID